MVLGGGAGTPAFSLKQDGEKLTGRYFGSMGEADVTGTVRGRNIEFSVPMQGRGIRMNYVGAFDGDVMKGKIKIGQPPQGRFNGRRESRK